MAMNPMQKKARISFLLGMFLTLIITGIIIIFLILSLSKMKKEQSEITYKDVYVMTSDVISGDKLSGKTKLETVDAAYVPSNAITKEKLLLISDATAKIDMKIGSVITEDMINQAGEADSSDVRLQEYNMIILPTQLAEGEHVDIRLRLPSGEDYIVVSKKYVEQTDSNTIWIKVSESEILTMSNAIVEAYIMPGSLLYATTYVDAGMQNSSSPTYIVTQEVLNLMKADPNITTTAFNALAQRYNAEGASAQRTNINKAVGGYSENALTNIETKLAEEIEKMQAARQQYVDGLGY